MAWINVPGLGANVRAKEDLALTISLWRCNRGRMADADGIYE
jgi:hypothetical protein